MHRRLLIPALAAAAALSLAACTPTTADPQATSATAREGALDADPAAESAVWDQTRLHSFAIDYDPGDYPALIAAYLADGDKVWISATVTIDGVEHANAGLKLKGNSSLRSLEDDADPATLPWIVRLDKFVDGASHDGATEFAIRGNSSATSLNEAVALDLLRATGLAAQEAIAVSLTIEGSDPTLRLVVENPNDAWMERELGDGYLYKAEAGGSYAFRGDEPDSYEGAFDQEGGEDDLIPLIDFLRFLDESDDATFAAELGTHLDVDAFATYLAFQEVVDNSDDIDGPGNNSYLYYDPDAARMAVVTWDLNLAFGASPGGPGGGTMRGPGGGTMRGPGERTLPDGATAPEGMTPAAAAEGGGRLGGSNVLSQRFLAHDDFAALVDAEVTRLTAELTESGVAAASLDDWTGLLLDEASDLVPTHTIEQESASLEGLLPS